MKAIATCVGLAIILLVLSAVILNQDHIHQAGGELLAAFILCVRGLVLLLLAAACVFTGVVAWTIVRRQQDRFNRSRDGTFPLRTYKLTEGATLLVNPNNMLASAAVIHPIHGYSEVGSDGGWDRQLDLRKAVQVTAHLQATSPGDDAISSKFGSLYRGGRSGIPNAATGKFLSGGWERPSPKPFQTEVVAPPVASNAEPMPLLAALQQSQADKFVLGHNDQTGALAVFNPRTSIHAAIIGASGTGKTESTGMEVALISLKHRYHLIILDPKGGADWRLFAHHAEWYETDSTVFADQMNGVLHEHQRRFRLVREQQAATIFELSPTLPPILVIIEEYGDLRDQMLAAGRARDAEHVELVMSKLFRLARMTGIGLVLIDQYPESWTRQAMTGTKAKFIYQLGPGQGNAVGQYHAQNLPDHGRFIYRGTEFNAWHVKPYAQKILQRWTPRPYPPVLDGVCTLVDESPAAPPMVQEPPSSPSPDPEPTKIQQAVRAWMDQHPDEVAANHQAPMRAALAQQGITISRGYASDLWHQYKAEIEEQLAKLTSTDLTTSEGRATLT